MLKRCGNCAHFTPKNSDDDAAPEGKCSVQNWKGPLLFYDKGEVDSVTWGYHPAVLRGDGCPQFSPAERMEKADG